MEYNMKIHPIDMWGEYFEQVEPLLKKYGTVIYSLKHEAYIVISNKEVDCLVEDMHLNLKNGYANKEAVKKWNEMLEVVEWVSNKYDCFIRITKARCLEASTLDVRMGKIESSIFGKYTI